MEIKAFLEEIVKYVKKNKTTIIFFFLAILLGATNIFGLGNEQLAYKSWELSSFVFTLGYTVAFYAFGYRNKYFKKLGGEKSIAIAIAIFILLLIITYIANDYLNIFKQSPGRPLTLFLMFLFVFVFSMINWALHKHFDSKSQSTKVTRRKERFTDLSRDFRSAVFMSDLPLAIAFLVLFVYYFINQAPNMEYFFSGAIAFQMMYSNAIWIFNDDRIFEPLD